MYFAGKINKAWPGMCPGSMPGQAGTDKQQPGKLRLRHVLILSRFGNFVADHFSIHM